MKKVLRSTLIAILAVTMCPAVMSAPVRAEGSISASLAISQVNVYAGGAGTAQFKWWTNENASCHQVVVTDVATAETITGTEGNDAMRSNHAISVAGLVTGHSYRYVITSKVHCNNEARAEHQGTFVLADLVAESDPGPFTLSDVVVKADSATVAQFKWTTNVNAACHSVVVTDPDTGRTMTEREGNEVMRQAHSIKVAGLTAQHEYRYLITSKVHCNNEVQATAEGTFRLADLLGTVPPDETGKVRSGEDRARLLNDDRIEELLRELSVLRNRVREQDVRIKYLAGLVKGMKGLSAASTSPLVNFIAYGADDDTKKLGEGERAAVINSFRAAYEKLPLTEEDLSDIIRIANGRWPSRTDDQAEKRAKENFKKIFKRVAVMEDPKDNAAITIMAYGLRQKAANRNLNSEARALASFRAIFGKLPSSTEDWNALQAITYSGSARQPDRDGDLLTDAQEQLLKTDPLKADTDGDGFSDGLEFENGHDPLKK